MLTFGDIAEKLIFWHLQHRMMTILGILVQRGRWSFSDAAKCSPLPLLYTTYDATYNGEWSDGSKVSW